MVKLLITSEIIDQIKRNFHPFFMIIQSLKQYKKKFKNSKSRTVTWPNADAPKERKIKFLSFNSSKKFKNRFVVLFFLHYLSLVGYNHQQTIFLFSFKAYFGGKLRQIWKNGNFSGFQFSWYANIIIVFISNN